MGSSQTKNETLIGGIGIFLLSLFVHALFGALASFASRHADDIYPKLKLPSFALDAIWHGKIWMVFYVILSLAVCFVWSKRAEFVVDQVTIPYLIHLVLQASWSWLFFDLGRADIAALEIMLLWGLSFWLMCCFMRVHISAGILMLIYHSWITYLALLHWSIFFLNGINALATSPK